MRTLRGVSPESEAEDSKCRPLHSPAIRSLTRSLLAGISVWSLLPIVLLLIHPDQPGLAGYGALVTGFFVLPATLLVLWPMDGFMPRSSRFWQPGWLILLGIVSGTLFFSGGMGSTFPRGLLEGTFWLSCLVFGGSYGATMSSVLGFLKRRA